MQTTLSNVTPVLRCGVNQLKLNQPRIMGILNVTPDSFSDGGRFVEVDQALAQTEQMLAAGADIIDIGGESTRPGADAVSVDQEIDRVVPVIELLKSRFDTIVSIDTSKAAVMRASAAAGVGLINDVRALREPGAMDAAVSLGLPVCLMHMLGEPRTMQTAPQYTNVVSEVADFLKERLEKCRSSGLDAGQIMIDPGFGFGKTLSHNVELLRNLSKLTDIAPVLIGLSRKSMIGQMLENDQQDRTVGSVTAALLCVQQGASVVRVHDVAETAAALKILNAVKNG